MDKINVCIACDDNYAKYAGVLIASVLSNAASNDNLAVYILDGGISEERKNEILTLKSIKDCEIDFVKVDTKAFDEYRSLKTNAYISLATYFRLSLPSILPTIDRIIYLDCDVVVNSSLHDLFYVDMQNNLAAGVLDISLKATKYRKNKNYVNAGVMLFDLKKMREENIEKKFLEYTASHIDTIKMGDQDIINEVCKDSILIVDDEWNVQSSNFTNRSSYTKNPKIIHYVAKRKPWHWASFSYHRPLYFKYLQMTPWKLNDKEYKHWTKDNQIASLIEYIKYRPLFFIRPRFYKALFYTYVR